MAKVKHKRATRIAHDGLQVTFEEVGETREWFATSKNISIGGILAGFSDIPDELSIGMMIDFTLTSYRLPKKVEGVASVVHLMGKEKSSDIGFEFVEFFENDREVWRGFVEELLRDANLPFFEEG